MTMDSKPYSEPPTSQKDAEDKHAERRPPLLSCRIKTRRCSGKRRKKIVADGRASGAGKSKKQTNDNEAKASLERVSAFDRPFGFCRLSRTEAAPPFYAVGLWRVYREKPTAQKTVATFTATSTSASRPLPIVLTSLSRTSVLLSVLPLLDAKSRFSRNQILSKPLDRQISGRYSPEELCCANW